MTGNRESLLKDNVKFVVSVRRSPVCFICHSSKLLKKIVPVGNICLFCLLAFSVPFPAFLCRPPDEDDFEQLCQSHVKLTHPSKLVLVPHKGNQSLARLSALTVAANLNAGQRETPSLASLFLPVRVADQILDARHALDRHGQSWP